MLDDTKKACIRAGFACLRTDPDTFARSFYISLFNLAPELRTLFADDLTAQAAKFQKIFAVLVTALDNLDKLEPMLKDLGARHVDYGVVSAHYDLVGEALLRTLADHIPSWGEQDVCAWSDLYRIVTEAMIPADRTLAPPDDRRASA